LDLARHLQPDSVSRHAIAAVMEPAYRDRAPDAALSLAAALTEYAAYVRAGERAGHQVSGLILVSAALAEAAGGGDLAPDEIRPALQMLLPPAASPPG
jgi:hypothetical protein